VSSASGETVTRQEPDAVSTANEEPAGKASNRDRNRIVLATTAVGVAGVTVWGVLNWDYFTRAPKAQSEGWFGPETDEGGMDKLGHFYTTYVLAHGIACLYEHCDFERKEAAFYGSLTSFAIMSYMEFGDSFSNYGFSYEDMVFNTLGSLMGYLLYVHPELSAKIDVRWQFGFTPNKADFLTDYSNSKFLFALKLNGFEAMQKRWLRHVELHVGYYTEGFDEPAEENLRHPYVGVGFNFTDLFRRHGYGKSATVLNYIQLPYTSVNYDFDL
jgi:hypothetical protein